MRSAGLWVRPVVAIFGAILLCGPPPSSGVSWPALTVEPIPWGAPPEVLDPQAHLQQEAIRSELLALLRAPEIPEPPAEPAGALVSWLIEILPYAEQLEVDRFAASADPEAWATADPDGRLPLAVALALAENGDRQEAIDWIERGAQNKDETSYRALLLLELCEAGGPPERAKSVAEEIRSSYPHQDWTMPAARFLMNACEEGGQFDRLLDESLRTRRDLGSGADETAARFRALRALRREEEARAVGDTLLERHIWSRTADNEALRRFREAQGRLGRAECLRLLPVFLHHGRFAEAETVLAALERPDSLTILLLERLAEMRLYDRILADSIPLSARCSSEQTARWLLVHARAARASLAWKPMESYYRRASAIPGATRKTALEEWGREAESEQRDALAESLYTELARIPGAEEEARFRRAIARYAAGRYAQADADLRSLRREVGNGGAGYWRFRLAEIVGDTARARSDLLVAAAGEGYYGGRARRELEQRALGQGGARFWDVEDSLLFVSRGVGPGGAPITCAGSERCAERARRLRLLRRFGRGEWAAREQESLERELPVADRLQHLFCLGLPDLAVRVAIGRNAQDLSLRYPRPFADLIEREASRAGIAAELVLAIARRESLFDPGAVSRAGATGLLQLMESTANRTSQNWGIPAGPLERVDRNVPLGVLHLKDLRTSLDWPLPALLAAYNAGEKKATEWVARFPDPDLFIERIGWHETRAYVRHVLDACWKYRAAYEGDASPQQDPGLPRGEEGSGTQERGDR